MLGGVLVGGDAEVVEVGAESAVGAGVLGVHPASAAVTTAAATVAVTVVAARWWRLLDHVVIHPLLQSFAFSSGDTGMRSLFCTGSGVLNPGRLGAAHGKGSERWSGVERSLGGAE